MNAAMIVRPCLVVLVVGLAACGRSETPAPTPAAPATPVAGTAAPPPKEEHIDIGGMKVDSGADVALPKDFPADIPLPPGAHLTDAISMGKIQIVAFTLSSDPAATFATMLPLYEAQGWKNSTRVGGQPVMASDGFEKDGRHLIYTVVADGGGSKVSLRHYPPAQ